MKKLILLLTVLTLGVIACDKNELGDMDSNSIKPIEMKDDKLNSIDDILSYLLNEIEEGDYNTVKKGNNPTAKGADYVTVYLFSKDTHKYTILLDETQDELCDESNGISVNKVYFDNVNNDGSAIRVEDADGNGIVTVNGNFELFFDGGINSASKRIKTTNERVASSSVISSTVTFSN